MPRPFHHPSAKDVTIDSVLHALSDRTRRDIVAKLIDSDGTSCARACKNLPPSMVLRDAGLIRSEKVGVEVINTVRKSEIDKRFPGLLEAVLCNHRAGR